VGKNNQRVLGLGKKIKEEYKKWKGRGKRREQFPWVIRENQCFHFPK
jgi:hypothetical protein